MTRQTLAMPSAARRRPFVSTVARAAVNAPVAAVAAGVVLLLLFAAAFPSFIAPHDPAAQDILHRLNGPSRTHLLGTDHIGRDILSRVIYAVHVAMKVSLPAVGVAVVLGSVLGLAGGYIGGWIDNVVVVVIDAIQSLPAVVLALALLSALGPHLWSLIVVIGLAFTPGYARVTRGLVLNARRTDYVDAERALGASVLRVVMLHIVPAVFAPLLIVIAIDIPAAITIETGLSFLGLGVQPPTPSFGTMLYDGFQYVRVSPWAVLFAGLTLMLATLAFTLLGEYFRDLADPRTAKTLSTKLQRA